MSDKCSLSFANVLALWDVKQTFKYDFCEVLVLIADGFLNI